MKKILVIEDDPGILIGLKELLTQEYFEITTSANGREGFNKALSEKPDLILLDVNLPEMNGFEISRKLREKKFYKPIIMLTSRAEQVDKVLGLEIGADDYVTKPFDNREIVARIHSQLRKEERTAEPEEDDYKKKLLTIMFTDIKDYSKKMNSDERRTLVLLKEHNSIMNKIINDFRGNVIEIIGDSFLASFESAVDAAECAVEIQNRLEKYNINKAPEDKIEVKISLHAGDVFQIGSRLKGDTINIAARILALTTAGKIYISQSVYSIIKGRTNLFFREIGTYSLKNIKEPATLYQILL